MVYSIIITAPQRYRSAPRVEVSNWSRDVVLSRWRARSASWLVQNCARSEGFSLVCPQVQGARPELNSGARGSFRVTSSCGSVHVRVTGPLRVASPVCVLPRRSSILLEGQRWWSSTAPWDWAAGPFGSPPQAEATVPLSFSQYQANTLLYEPTPSPFGDYGRNGSLFSGRAHPSRSPALDPARAGLSRCRGLRVKRRPALGPSCGVGPGREERA